MRRFRTPFRTTPLIISIVGVALLAVACGSSSSDPDVVNAASGGGSAGGGTPNIQHDFPGNLNTSLPVSDEPLGTILDTEELDLGPNVIGYRILYVSESLRGDPIPVSGYVVSKSGTPPTGGWPLIAWAHGTVGMADKCANSNDVAGERDLWSRLLDAGFAVVATDYEGLGTPGLHPYIVGKSEARGVYDSVRAVQNHDGKLGDIEVSQGWVVWGHSQGGHAAMHVAQNTDYAPDLDLLGAVAGAPPSQFGLLYDALIGGPFQGYIAMATAAYEEVYDDVDLTAILTDKAISLLPIMDEECLDEVFNVFNPLAPEELSKVENPLEVPPIDRYTMENDTATNPVQVPTLIIHGEDDEQIIPISSLLLLGQQCGISDQPIQRLAYPDANHSGVIEVSVDDMVAWMNARFAGDVPPDDCPPKN